MGWIDNSSSVSFNFLPASRNLQHLAPRVTSVALIGRHFEIEVKASSGLSSFGTQVGLLRSRLLVALTAWEIRHTGLLSSEE